MTSYTLYVDNIPAMNQRVNDLKAHLKGIKVTAMRISGGRVYMWKARDFNYVKLVKWLRRAPWSVAVNITLVIKGPEQFRPRIVEVL
jgi:hypothetical protein